VRGRRGQAMLEYVLAFAALLVVVGVMGSVIVAAQRQSARATGLVRADYP